MKLKIKSKRLVALYALFFTASLAMAQINNNDSLSGFDIKGALRHSSYAITISEKNNFLDWAKRQFIKKKYFSVAKKSSPLQTSSIINCENIGFENNNTNGWTINGDAQITSGSVLDPFGGFPQVFPGGKHSLKLNNNNINGKTNFSASASRVISVSSDNNYLNLHFALAVLNFPHDEAAAAKFKIEVLDSANNVLECPKYKCYYFEDQGGGHAVGISSFEQTEDTIGENIALQIFPVSYSPWQTISLDLKSYVGQTINLKISCDWCAYDFDWAYCYIDADCGQVSAPKYFACGALPEKLTGPLNMGKYLWLSPDKDTVSTSVSCNALVAGLYTLQCNPDINCQVLGYTYVYSTFPQIEASFEVDKIEGFAPLSINCANTTITHKPLTSSTPLWTFGNGKSQVGGNNATTTYIAAGTYTVRLFSSKKGCVDTAYKIVKVEMPSKLEVPDVFTPNGDGNNDVFFLRTASLNEINAIVFDRWGNKVYETKSNTGNIAWDGNNSKGNECAAGVYFYIINATGKDEQTYAQKGNISLFR
jgi:gliding motility-associated-like protein